MPLDVAAALDFLVHAAEYTGSLTANTKEAYDALNWQDERPKPTWEAIQAVDTTPKLSKLDALVEAYRTLPVEKRVKYAGIMAPARDFVEKGDTEAAALLLSKLSVAEDEQPLKQAFIEIVTGG